MDEKAKHVDSQGLGKEPANEGFGLTDSATAEAFRRIPALYGTATRVVVKRRLHSGKFQYVRGASITIDPPPVNLQINERRKAHVSKRKPGSGKQAE